MAEIFPHSRLEKITYQERTGGLLKTDGESDDQSDLDKLLAELIDKRGSDLHLKVGQPPVIRLNGKLERLQHPPLSEKRMTQLIEENLSVARLAILETEWELDMAYSAPGLGRFRVNIFHQNSKLGAVFRLIPFRILTIEELGLPSTLKALCELPRGLVLVTGPTGSGKSTTLAAMVDHINENRACHIVTIEDPIEFLHGDKKSAINQRELGVDTHSFASALKQVLRQSPDVILVGELRDLETIELAVTAAETGHLVFATLHTVDAAQTIDRIVDVFPSDQQSQVRMQLSSTLQGVVSQTLVPTSSDEGRIAACEIMVCNSGIRHLIRKGKTHQIYTLIQTGGEYGMQLLDDSLAQLVRTRKVTYEEAAARCSQPREFEKLIARKGVY